ncbi:efflux transporter, outer membrane factor (OMF) lipoprotein, NodT family [Luteitalea pratensis]|uniref:Efflux transporter, outer membrane factor (OMF) lipoprotein, NodT family n=1 Tax=Luteitalea pratensis TaxID=1855912 RepID=A0A143PQ07_LUTPR|nr:TolC family protein [Luteitalea pratensis]AMY10797.1 efflux transporter, outer membrane factor (OMF) lipoprotein, NodT family [Luteitalea pratensis]
MIRVIALTVLVVLTPAWVPALAQSTGTIPIKASDLLDESEGLALADAMTRAVEGEPELRAARYEVEVSRAVTKQAELRPNPSISVERREEPSGTDNLTAFAVDWPLDLFRRDARVSVATLDADTAARTYDDRIRRLLGEVRDAYGAAAAAVREIVVLDELIAAGTRQLEVLSARVTQGASPPLDRNVLAVDVRRLEADRMLQAGRAVVLMMRLKRLIGLAPEAPLRLRHTIESLVLQDTAVVPTALPEAGVVDRRPDLRAAETRVAASAARVEQAQHEGRVDAGVFGSYMRMNSGFPQQGIGPGATLERVQGVFHYVSAGLRVSLPLFNRNQGALEAAEAQHTAEEAKRDAVRLEAQTELAAARAGDAAAQSARIHVREARVQAAENLAVIQQAYDLGRLRISDVLVEQRRFLELEREYTEALRLAYEARTALRLATGDVR